MKTAETKHYTIAVENQQLFHNLGWGVVGIPPVNWSSIPLLFNPWRYIPKGTGRSERIGDKITPRGMSLRIFLANKDNRPNVQYRVIVAVLPRNVGSTVTTSSFDPWQGPDQGTCANALCQIPDADRGVKFLYDKIVRPGAQQHQGTAAAAAKEMTKSMKLWIKRKRSRDIVFNDNQLEIVNKPLAIYVLPYEQFSTLQTDNIATFGCFMRLYYKDV